MECRCVPRYSFFGIHGFAPSPGFLSPFSTPSVTRLRIHYPSPCVACTAMAMAYVASSAGDTTTDTTGRPSPTPPHGGSVARSLSASRVLFEVLPPHPTVPQRPTPFQNPHSHPPIHSHLRHKSLFCMRARVKGGESPVGPPVFDVERPGSPGADLGGGPIWEGGVLGVRG